MIPIAGNLALFALVALVAVLALLRWPEAGTLIATALLYLNLLPVAIAYHHVPPVFAALMVVLVAPPLVKYLVLDHGSLIVDRSVLLMFVFLACIIVSSLVSNSIELSLPWIARYVTQG